MTIRDRMPIVEADLPPARFADGGHANTGAGFFPEESTPSKSKLRNSGFCTMNQIRFDKAGPKSSPRSE
jgi:hypothetical protein